MLRKVARPTSPISSAPTGPPIDASTRSPSTSAPSCAPSRPAAPPCSVGISTCAHLRRSEEHTSELQSQSNLVCRLLLEKKKKTNIKATQSPWYDARDEKLSTRTRLSVT